MAGKVLAIKFLTTDKKNIKGKVKHSRTGACTAKGRCYYGKNYHGRS